MLNTIDKRILLGRVVRGEGRGRKLGFRTANMSLLYQEELPKHGVYASKVVIKGRTYKALANIGCAKTFGATIATIEPHILDFCENIYGEIILLILYQHLRPMIKFPCPALLIRQLKQDCRDIREYFEIHEPNRVM